jgi:hypothetical protein
MPLITTHNYFANDVLKETKINKKIDKNIYELFSQGFDPLYFYDFFKLSQTTYQSYCHNNNTDDYFINFINNIKKQNKQNDPLILASLYGSLTHYVLDSTCHPYIVYKTGFYYKNKKETKKYQGLHSKMEMQIDAYLYEHKTNKPFKNFKIHKELIPKIKLSEELLNILNKTYDETFKIPKGGNKYQKGCTEMYYTYKFLVEDKTGIKTKIYKLLDKIIPSKLGKYETFSSNIKEIDNKIFNLKHNTWQNPWSGKKYNTSFFDLYNEAKEECLNIFIATEKFIKDEINTNEYKKILKDNSYLTGLSWRKKSEIKYLEF